MNMLVRVTAGVGIALGVASSADEKDLVGGTTTVLSGAVRVLRK